jgi:hypothetical protein
VTNRAHAGHVLNALACAVATSRTGYSTVKPAFEPAGKPAATFLWMRCAAVRVCISSRRG